MQKEGGGGEEVVGYPHTLASTKIETLVNQPLAAAPWIGG